MNPDAGVQVQTSTTEVISEDSFVQIPELIRELFTVTGNVQMVDPSAAIDRFSEMVQSIDISPERRTQLAGLMNTNAIPSSDISPVEEKMNTRFDQIASAIQHDITENTQVIDDLKGWARGSKKPEDIALIATKIPGVGHLAEAEKSDRGHLLALNTAILNPIASLNSINPTPLIAPLAVSPTPDPVVAPSARTTFENMVQDTKITKTRGLYVSHGNTTQRLIDYTEKLDGNTKIHTLDDDRDGDLDVYYSLGRVVYRKENYSKKPSPYIIKDAPRVYTVTDIYEDFFGIKNSVLSSVSGDGQITLIQNDTSSRVKYQLLMKNGIEHMKLRLYRSLFKTEAKDARYQVDILPENKETSKNTVNMPVTYIDDIDGLVFIEHKKIYRKLLTGEEYVNEEGQIEKLSSDFVIRSGQSGYTSESSSIDVINNGVAKTYKLPAGQRIVF